MGTIYRAIAKIFPFAVIGILGTIIYSPSFHGFFQFDDNGFIVNNPVIRDINNVQAIWNGFPNPARFIGSYSFALNYHFHQLDVFGFHVVNFVIHCINTILVWWLMSLLLSSPGIKEGLVDTKQKIEHKRFNQQKGIVAFLTALLFLTHPIQTQAVTYITQRFASLATLFYLASVCFYIKGRQEEGRGKVYVLFWLASAIAAILGMLTKQIVLTLPLAVILVEFSLFKQVPQSRRMQFIFAVLLFFIGYSILLFF